MFKHQMLRDACNDFDKHILKYKLISATLHEINLDMLLQNQSAKQHLGCHTPI